jgi:type IV secretory pathway TrbD component
LNDKLARAFLCVLLLAALIGDAIIARQMMRNENDFYFSGPFGVVLAVSLAVALVGTTLRTYVLAAGVALFVWLGAAAVGAMGAQCDPVMVPFIVPMVATIMSAPLVASGAVLGAVPIAILGGWAGSRALPIPTAQTYGIILAVGVVVAIASFALSFALGARPTTTACVL